MFVKNIENFKMQVIRKTDDSSYSNIYGKVYDCVAPCSMYSVLLDAKDIDDPFVALNEYPVAELSRNDCVFISTFTVSKEEYAKKKKTLVFYGLDTVCDVYLNGVRILKADNMHRTYKVDCGEDLKIGDNELKLYFYSPLTYTETIGEKHPLHFWNELNEGVGHLRKAFYMFSWDWGPRVPDAGIFRKIEFQATDYAEIEEVRVEQIHASGEVNLNVYIKTSEAGDYACKITFDGKTYGLELETDKTVLKTDREKTYVLKNLKVDDPKLWWPNGYGEQPLYDLKTELFINGTKIDEDNKRIGLRTLKVRTNLDEYGRNFCFICNGVELFLKGANYIPQDNILSRVTRQTTDALIKNCIDMNFNAIRVWGGGYYPDDDFFDLCDENGIIVWHDFMVACVCVRASEKFKASFLAEVQDNVKRIRHHAALGLLGGNNEVEDMISNMDNALVKADYIDLYERAIPELLDEIAPEIYYLPSSPTNRTTFYNVQNQRSFDVHFWGVWHDSLPFTAYRDIKCRFMSEFGFISFPDIKTTRYFAEDEDLNPFSEVMESHQKDHKGRNKKIIDYIADNYLLPANFEDLTYISQILQADAIRYGVEHFRRIRNICKGTFYWQLNDCWPTSSWSSVDYFGRKKALAYASKKFYEPIMLSICERETDADINVSNETLKEFTGKVKYEFKTEDFTLLRGGEITVSVNPQTATDVLRLDYKDIAKEHLRDGFLTVTLLDDNGVELAKQTLLFTKPKYFKFKNPELSVKITKNSNVATVTVSAKRYAKNVAIFFKNHDIKLSDNYFDITDGNGYKVSFETDLSEAEISEDMYLKTVFGCKMN